VRARAADADPGERVLNACPACGAPAGDPFATGAGIRLVRCTDCTLVYSNPQPLAAVRARYLEEYDLRAHFEALGRRKRVLFERRLEQIGRPADGRDRLCDVGCAGGQFLEIAESGGWKPSGIELNPPAVAAARATGATIYEGALEGLEDLPWGTFNVVTCWDVLEHTPTPTAFARKLSRLLAPDGFLAITTLNWSALVRRVVGMRWSMIADEHFTYWTRKALCGLLERENLTLTSITSFGLGRDLVQPLEAVIERVQQPRRGRDEATPVGRSWETSSATLLAERLANVALGLTDSGVGLAATFRPA
jgi:SAM-dependent methyltransferase